MKDLLGLKDLTPGERLWVWRRREGMRSEVLAKRLGVGPKVITAWERGERGEDVPDVTLEEPLRIGEQLALVRRRKGWSIRITAMKMGTSHVTIIRLERGGGDVEGAVEFWRKEGGW